MNATCAGPSGRWTAGLALALAMLVEGIAHAQSCTASATPTAFGTYHPFAASPTDTHGSVSVRCEAFPVGLLLDYTISLSSGGGSYASRRMSYGGSQLAYQLYADPQHSVVWGDGSGGSSPLHGGLLLSLLVPVSFAHPVYGRIAAGQTGAVPGAYSDAITVTVSY